MDTVVHVILLQESMAGTMNYKINLQISNVDNLFWWGHEGRNVIVWCQKLEGKG